MGELSDKEAPVKLFFFFKVTLPFLPLYSSLEYFLMRIVSKGMLLLRKKVLNKTILSVIVQAGKQKPL